MKINKIFWIILGFVSLGIGAVGAVLPVYMYVVPTTTVNTYRLSTGGEKVLLDTDVTTAEVGVYIRTATIDKLFSDTNKLFRGEQIDTMALN